ncbi:triacylglycerol lipase 2-like [Prosopis cineraria]|uniref:triacylglycerol lipase 2-like n=1 Tax=Prosopis cineraria TaxID=364024 RepID=UPI00240FE010|nr:triacylglycerol lipase 2-like [Prosopis cineraria]
MAKKILLTLLSIFLVCILEAQGRKSLYSMNGKDELPVFFPSDHSDGICKSMVETQGYKCEEHKVTTNDGFILSLQRIPAGQSGKIADKPPVLLQHGLFSDAMIWLFNSPDESLGFILADNGYDVWLANTRGTRYSSGHTSLTPSDKAYWEWSWDELVSYDLKACVEYVYNQTGQKLHYTGHSLGTLIALAAFSEGEMVNMIRSAALLSPIAHLNQIPSPAIKFAANIFLADDLYWLGLREFNLKEQDASKLLEGICKIPGINCANLLTVFTGPNCCINSTRIDVYLDHEPQPTSTKNLIHLAQMVRTGDIAMYNYGDQAQNMQHYGQASPPVYDMTSIPNDLPLFLSNGGKDTLSDVNDVAVFLDDLKDHNKDKLVVLSIDEYAHVDFVMGVNAKQVVYELMIDFFNHN